MAQAPAIKKTTYGVGLLKGMIITLRHMLSHSVTVEYPMDKPPLPARSRGVIALKEENCTVCMLCAKECPDWCIYIEGHKQQRKPKDPGKRTKAYNVLDRFAIDYALCMYCGICVDVCPYDALFWQPEFEYAEQDITALTHEMDRLAQWMYGVPAPEALEEGAQAPEVKVKLPAAQTAAVARAPSGPVAAPSTAPPVSAPISTSTEAAGSAAPLTPANVEAPTSVAPLDPEEIYQQVRKEELAKGTDARVAEARAKAARTRAIKRSSGQGQQGL